MTRKSEGGFTEFIELNRSSHLLQIYLLFAPAFANERTFFFLTMTAALSPFEIARQRLLIDFQINEVTNTQQEYMSQ